MNTLEKTPEGWIFSTLSNDNWARFPFTKDTELVQYLLENGLYDRKYDNILMRVGAKVV